MHSILQYLEIIFTPQSLINKYKYCNYWIINFSYVTSCLGTYKADFLTSLAQNTNSGVADRYESTLQPLTSGR